MDTFNQWAMTMFRRRAALPWALALLSWSCAGFDGGPRRPSRGFHGALRAASSERGGGASDAAALLGVVNAAVGSGQGKHSRSTRRVTKNKYARGADGKRPRSAGGAPGDDADETTDGGAARDMDPWERQLQAAASAEVEQRQRAHAAAAGYGGVPRDELRGEGNAAALADDDDDDGGAGAGADADADAAAARGAGGDDEWPDEETIDPYEPSSFGFTEVRSRRTG